MKKSLFALILLLLIPHTTFAVPPFVLASGSQDTAATNYTQDANCQGAWYMNNNGGTETDRSGNSADLTQSGGTIPTSATVPSGYSGNSRDFEASETEWLYQADGGSTDISGANQAISIVCWVKLESITADGDFAAKWRTSDSNRSFRFYVESSDDTVRFYLSDTGGAGAVPAISATTFTADTNWHHFAAVYNDTDIRIYVDGSLDSNGADNPKTYSAGLYNSADEFYLGRDDGGSYLDGLLDEVAIFDRALSAAEVSEIYTYGIDGAKGGND